MVEVTGQSRVEGRPLDFRDSVADRRSGPRGAEQPVAVGRDMNTGDVLLELETEIGQHQIREQGAEMAAIGPELTALRSQVAAEEAGGWLSCERRG